MFARKPLFGYQFVVFSGIAIGFIGFGVWAHHMFAAGLGPVANTAFGISTAIIAHPDRREDLQLDGHDVARRPALHSRRCCSRSARVTMFVIGGLSGVTHAIVPADYQQTDTYYIVAHFHYVLFGGAIFGLFRRLYYWWPKVFGRLLTRGLGKVHFWLMLIGFNLTFGPMHILGLQGMIRREYTYPASLGLTFWNQVSTVGAFLIALSILVFIVERGGTMRRRPLGSRRPVGRAHARVDDVVAAARSTTSTRSRPSTRSTSSGTASTPRTRAGGSCRVAGGCRGSPRRRRAHGGGARIHLPSPSYWPLVAALGLPIIGLRRHLFVVAALALGVRRSRSSGFYGWALEPSVA